MGVHCLKATGEVFSIERQSDAFFYDICME